jgi:acyl carrier protein
MDAPARKQEVARMVRELLLEKFGDEMEIEPDQPLEQAGLDSVDMLDALAVIEERFDVTFERDDLVGIASLAELYEVVYDRLLLEKGEDFAIE